MDVASWLRRLHATPNMAIEPFTTWNNTPLHRARFADVEVIVGTDVETSTTMMLRGGEDSDVRVKVLTRAGQGDPCGFVFIIDNDRATALADALEYASAVLRSQISQGVQS